MPPPKVLIHNLAFLILVDTGDEVIAQALGIAGDMFIAGKIIFCRIKPVEPVDGAHPKLLGCDLHRYNGYNYR